MRVPFSTFPAAAIGENARLIGRLFRQVRFGPEETRRTRTYKTEDGRIDLAATAFNLGLSEDKLEDRIAMRRRQTARLSYGSFALGCVFVVLWLYQALSSGLAGPHLIAALQFAPFVAVFFLVAFKYAYINWQLRTGQSGSAAEYLQSPEPFLPR